MKFAGLLLFALTLTVSAAAQTASVDEAAEAKIAQEINALREKQGLKPLKIDLRLRQIARAHSELLAKHKELRDQFPEEGTLQDRVASAGMKKVDSGAENSGQNVDVAKVNQMFLDSPGHKANLLNPKFNVMGVGVVKDAQTNWVTQVFIENRGDVQEVK
jgi:uncharacterized protein YkwD